jgi:flagellar L-ring protein precursor FlgH
MKTTRILAQHHCSPSGLPLATILIWLAISIGEANADQWALANRLYSDVKARAVGDLVTIVIDENSTVNRAAQQASDKNTTGSGSASFSRPYLSPGGQDGQSWTQATLPAFNWNLNNSFSGDGSMSSSDDFQATVSARVVDVLPNGTLLLEGKRTVRLQKETVNVVLSGLVRPKDIDSNNEVMSSRLADASIRYQSDGPLTRDHERGLFTRLINWINPF